MKRREFLVLPALPALACDMPKTQLPAQFGGPPPWHMWGGSIVATSTIPLTGVAQNQGVQIAKVAYKRPESWNFLFYAELLATPAVQDTSVILVDFDIMIGIGRTVVTLGRSDTPAPEAGTSENTRGYARLRWDTANPRFDSQRKWTTVGTMPIPDDQEPTVGSRISEYFVAQDIQCKARVYVSGTVGFTYRVAVSAMFAPRTHIRPDWFQDAPDLQFRGAEQGGT